MQDNNKLYHIGLSKEDIEEAKYAILPGDPGRVEKIAKLLKNSRKIGENREYNSYLGEIENEKVLVISTGMGGPSTAICVEELAMLGVNNLIRVGTCGGMQLKVYAGDIVIAQGAIRQEGTSKEYVPVEFPAVADIDITNALIEASKILGYTTHVGIVHCKDSYYGQHDPERMPTSYELESKWEAWIKAGALASEMETAALYIVSSLLNVKAGAVLLAIWNQEREKENLDNNTNFDVEKEIEIAIKAIELLIKNKN